MNRSTILGAAGLLALVAAAPAMGAPAAAVSAAINNAKVDAAKAVQGKTGAELQSIVSSLPAPQRAEIARALVVDKRIVGGVKVMSLADAPWQVALIRGVVSPGRSQFCGGTLIAPDVVLTAAHCVDNNIVRKRASKVDVVAGTLTYNSGGERLKVSAIFVHPEWSSASMDNDFAILKLASRSTLGVPAALEASPAPIPSDGFVTGWGALSEGGFGSTDLMGVVVPLVPTDECNKPDSYNGDVTPRMLCAGKREGGLDSCQGDSGGPLVSADTDRLIGVVSFGEGCARELKYGIYSRVSAVVPWLQAYANPQIAIAAAGGGGTGGDGR